MNRLSKRGLVLSVAALVAGAGAQASMDWARAREYREIGQRATTAKRMELVLRGWPRESGALARATIAEYGVPDQVLPTELSWSDCRPWKRIVVFRDELSADRPDRLLQSVSYRAPAERLPALGSFGHGVSYDAAAGELAARSDGQAANRLALNLADEIVRRRRGVADASAFYDATLSLSSSGKSSPYLERLLFRGK